MSLLCVIKAANLTYASNTIFHRYPEKILNLFDIYKYSRKITGFNPRNTRNSRRIISLAKEIILNPNKLLNEFVEYLPDAEYLRINKGLPYFSALFAVVWIDMVSVWYWKYMVEEVGRFEEPSIDYFEEILKYIMDTDRNEIDDQFKLYLSSPIRLLLELKYYGKELINILKPLWDEYISEYNRITPRTRPFKKLILKFDNDKIWTHRSAKLRRRRKSRRIFSVLDLFEMGDDCYYNPSKLSSIAAEKVKEIYDERDLNRVFRNISTDLFPELTED